ncbi:unnamed protein product, partial [Prorocentrum cordatum]
CPAIPALPACPACPGAPAPVSAPSASGGLSELPDLRLLIAFASLLVLASCGCMGAAVVTVWGTSRPLGRRSSAAEPRAESTPTILDQEAELGSLAQEQLSVIRQRRMQGLGIEAGDFGAVQYNVPGAPLYHERLVLIEPGAGTTVSVLTPDGDNYEADIIWFGLMAGGACGGGAPLGAGGAVVPVYRFQHVPTPAAFQEEACQPWELESELWLRPWVLRLWPLELAPSLALEVLYLEPGPLLALTCLLLLGHSLWVLAVSSYLEAVVLELQLLEEHRCLLWMFVSSLSVTMTTLWLCRFMVSNGQTPLGRHARWKADAKLQNNDGGVENHLMCCQMLESLATFDQLNLPDIAGAEIMARSIQLSEERYRDRMPSFAGSSGETTQDAFLYMGLDHVRGNVAVCPALQSWVSAELQKEVSVMKERRKAREERASAKQNKNKTKKDGKVHAACVTTMLSTGDTDWLCDYQVNLLRDVNEAKAGKLKRERSTRAQQAAAKVEATVAFPWMSVLEKIAVKPGTVALYQGVLVLRGAPCAELARPPCAAGRERFREFLAGAARRPLVGDARGVGGETRGTGGGLLDDALEAEQEAKRAARPKATALRSAGLAFGTAEGRARGKDKAPLDADPALADASQALHMAHQRQADCQQAVERVRGAAAGEVSVREMLVTWGGSWTAKGHQLMQARVLGQDDEAMLARVASCAAGNRRTHFVAGPSPALELRRQMSQLIQSVPVRRQMSQLIQSVPAPLAAELLPSGQHAGPGAAAQRRGRAASRGLASPAG